MADILLSVRQLDEKRLHWRAKIEGPAEHVGDALGFVARRVEGDLERFKTFMEERGRATGAWRGEIHGQKVNVH